MLTRLKVQNYKSLENVEISLKPLTVFVGPNNAGKSNILDCLRFLKELGELGAPAVNSRGGFRYLVWGGDLKRTISVEIEQRVPIDSRGGVTYQVEISGGPTAYSVVREVLQEFWIMSDRGAIPEWVAKKLRDQPGVPRTKVSRDLLRFPVSERMAAVYEAQGMVKRKVDPLRLSLFQVPEPEIVYSLAQDIRKWTFYNFVPSRMRLPNPARRELRVGTEGENVSAVLHSLHSEYSENFKEIEEALKAGIPEIRRVLTPLTEQGETYISLEESGLSISIPTWAMSDGTLQILAQLAVISSTEFPTLACFEEPEGRIHPRLLELVLDVLKSASKRTQILMTTHSPYLLDFLGSPENLIVVEKVGGKTQCKPVQDQEGVKEALKTLGLGELWYSGHIGGTP